jgi:hypothetical protein
MTQALADFYPQKINQHVPNMTYSADVVMEGPAHIQLGAPVTADPNGIIAAQSVAAAGETTTFASAYSRDAMARYGRAVEVDLSGAGTGNITITGRDYLGQPMVEVIALNGTTAVVGQKAFAWIEKVEWPTVGAVTLDVGWNDVLGLPYKTEAIITELEDGAVPTGGTFAAGDETTPTTTTNDPRGTYDPNSACDGTAVFELYVICDRTNLHGEAHYFA